ncbi:conserved hypothetical protein [Neospora caninum Liverpool]|uniref:Tetratricopeptide repeat-containing protein n=1 Tax=Neospora caninum (strain Liverpool) TaxID=572307 RepID=F0VGQ3_NEOCL|nr:conserved hypothetical protein [Neospora caninum Liverpool]CBZ52897.1 conserved hypothetical protein [Neospora caninum Liverpool]CEL66879.1 TPA: tetratricopeptide repeat-containing protein [Neospora caninum Liverpool]|eukprot:XP_003882929.1 conserved hypothetical protein [Neospora caninum Liverpool]
MDALFGGASEAEAGAPDASHTPLPSSFAPHLPAQSASPFCLAPVHSSALLSGQFPSSLPSASPDGLRPSSLAPSAAAPPASSPGSHLDRAAALWPSYPLEKSESPAQGFDSARRSRFPLPGPSARQSRDILSLPSVARCVSTCLQHLRVAHAEAHWEAIYSLSEELRKALLVPASALPQRLREPAQGGTACKHLAEDGKSGRERGHEERKGSHGRDSGNDESAHASSLCPVAPASEVPPKPLEAGTGQPGAGQPDSSDGSPRDGGLEAPHVLISSQPDAAPPESGARQLSDSLPDLVFPGAGASRGSVCEGLSSNGSPPGVLASSFASCAPHEHAGTSASFQKSSSSLLHQLCSTLAVPLRSSFRGSQAGRDRRPGREGDDEESDDDFLWPGTRDKDAEGEKKLRRSRLRHSAFVEFYEAEIEACLHLGRYNEAAALVKEFVKDERTADGTRETPSGLAAPLRALWARRAQETRAADGDDVGDGRACDTAGAREVAANAQDGGGYASKVKTPPRHSDARTPCCEDPKRSCADMPAFSLLPFLRPSHACTQRATHRDALATPSSPLFSSRCAGPTFPPLDVWLLWLKTLVRASSFRALHEALLASPPSAIWALLETCLPLSACAVEARSSLALFDPLQPLLSLFLSASPPPVEMGTDRGDSAASTAHLCSPSKSEGPQLRPPDLDGTPRRRGVSSLSGGDKRHASFVFFSPFFFFRLFARQPAARQMLVLEALATIGLLCSLARLHALARGFYELVLLLACPPSALLAKRRFPELPTAAAALLLRLQARQTLVHADWIEAFRPADHLASSSGAHAGWDACDVLVRGFALTPPSRARPPGASFSSLFLAFLPCFVEPFWARVRRSRRLASLSGPLGAVVDFADIQYLACHHSRLSRPLASEAFFALAPRCRSRLRVRRPAGRDPEPGRNPSGPAALGKGFSFRHAFLPHDRAKLEAKMSLPVRVSTNDSTRREGLTGSEAPESVCTGLKAPSIPTSHAPSIASTPRGGGGKPACDAAASMLLAHANGDFPPSWAGLTGLERSLRRWRTEAEDGGLVRGLLAEPLVPFDRGTLTGLGRIRRRAFLAAQALVVGPMASLSTQSSSARRRAYWQLHEESQTARALRAAAASGSRRSSASESGARTVGFSPRGCGLGAPFDGDGSGKRMKRGTSTESAGGPRESVYASIRRALSKTFRNSLGAGDAGQDGVERFASLPRETPIGAHGSGPSSSRASRQASWQAEETADDGRGAGGGLATVETRDVLWETWRLADESEETEEWATVFGDSSAAPQLGGAGPESGVDATLASQLAAKGARFAAGRVYAEAARCVHVCGSLLAFLPACALDARFVFSLHLHQLKEFANYRSGPFKRSRLASLLALCCCRPGDADEDPLKLYASAVVRDLRRLEAKAPEAYRNTTTGAAASPALEGAAQVAATRDAEATGGPETGRGGARERTGTRRLGSPKCVLGAPLAEASRQAARAVGMAMEAERRHALRVRGPGAGLERRGGGEADKEGSHRPTELFAPASGENSVVPWSRGRRGGDGGGEENGERADEDDMALLWGGGTRGGSAVINSLLAFLLQTSELSALLLLPYAVYSVQSGESVLELRWEGREETVSPKARGPYSRVPAPGETAERWVQACMVKYGVPGRGGGGDAADATGTAGVALPQLANLLEQTALLSLSSKFSERLMQRLLERLALTQFFQGNFHLSLAALGQLEEKRKSAFRSFEDADGVRLLDGAAIEKLFGDGNAGRFSSGFLASVKAKLLLTYLQRPATAGLAVAEALTRVASLQRERKERYGEEQGGSPCRAGDQSSPAKGRTDAGNAQPLSAAAVATSGDPEAGASGRGVDTHAEARESARAAGGARERRDTQNTEPTPRGALWCARGRLLRTPFRSLRPPTSSQRDEATTLNLLLLLGQAALVQARQTRLFALPAGLLPADPLPGCSASSVSSPQAQSEKETLQEGPPARGRGAETGEKTDSAQAGGPGKVQESAASPESAATKNESGFLEYRFGDERKAEIATYPNLVNRAYRCGTSALRLWGGAVDARVWALLAWTAMHAFDLPACAEFARKALLLDRRDTRVWLLLAWCHSGRLPALPPSHDDYRRRRLSASETRCGVGEGQRQSRETGGSSGPVSDRTCPAVGEPADSRASTSAQDALSGGPSVWGFGTETACPRFPAAPVLQGDSRLDRLAVGCAAASQCVPVESGLVPFLNVVHSAVAEHPTSLSLVMAKVWTQVRHSPSFRLFSYGESLGHASPEGQAALGPLDNFPSRSQGASRRPQQTDARHSEACGEAATRTQGVSGVAAGNTGWASAPDSGETHGVAEAPSGRDSGSQNRLDGGRDEEGGDRKPSHAENNAPAGGTCGAAAGPAHSGDWRVSSLASVAREDPGGCRLSDRTRGDNFEAAEGDANTYTCCGLFWLAEERRHAALSMETPAVSPSNATPSSGGAGSPFLHAPTPATTSDSGDSEAEGLPGFARSPRFSRSPSAGSEKLHGGCGPEARPGSGLDDPSRVSFPLARPLRERWRSHGKPCGAPQPFVRAPWGARLFSVEASLQHVEAFFSAVGRHVHKTSLAVAPTATHICFSCHAARHVHLLPCAMHALQRLSAELASLGPGSSFCPSLQGCSAAAARLDVQRPPSGLSCFPAASDESHRLGLAHSLSWVAFAAASGDGTAAERGLSEAEMQTLRENRVLSSVPGDVQLATASTLCSACVLHDCTREPSLYEAARQFEAETPAEVETREDELQSGAGCLLTDPYSPFYLGSTTPGSAVQSAGSHRDVDTRRSTALGGVLDAKHIERETVGWMVLAELLCHLGAASSCVGAALQIAGLYLHCLRGVAATAVVEPNRDGPHARSPEERRRRGSSGANEACKRRDGNSSPRRRRHSSVGLSTKHTGRRRAGGGPSWPEGDGSPQRHEACPSRGHGDSVCQRCGFAGRPAAEELAGRVGQLHVWPTSWGHLACRGDTPETDPLGVGAQRGEPRSEQCLSGAPENGHPTEGVWSSSPGPPRSGLGWAPGELLGVKLQFLRLYAEYFYAEEEEQRLKAEVEFQAVPRLQSAFAAWTPVRNVSLFSGVSEAGSGVGDSSERRHRSAPHSRSSSVEGPLKKTSRVFTGHEKPFPSLRLSGFRRSLHGSCEADGGVSKALPCWDEGLCSPGPLQACPPSCGAQGDTVAAELRDPGDVSFAGITAAAAAAALATSAGGPSDGAGVSPPWDGAWRLPCGASTGRPDPRSSRCLSRLLEKVREFRRLHPHSRPAQILEARLLYRQRNLAKCLALLEGLAALETEEMCLDGDTDFLQESLGAYLHGKCLQALGQFETAARAFERAMRLYFNAPMLKTSLVEIDALLG